jgi:hypothetical protein
MGYFKTLLLGDTISDELEEVTIDRGSFSFGTIAPGEEAAPIIIALKAFDISEIGNIKLALTYTGDITFADNIFGIATSPSINRNLNVDTFFQGVNLDKDESSSYNVAINNENGLLSEFVYLTVNIPTGMELQTGVVRYKWFFDYSGKVIGPTI